jgi:hypothetical protein
MPSLNNMGTYVVDNKVGTVTISKDDGLRSLTLLLSAGGSAKVKGAAKTAAFGSSVDAPLVAGVPMQITNSDPIDGLTITVAAGTVTVFTGQ